MKKQYCFIAIFIIILALLFSPANCLAEVTIGGGYGASYAGFGGNILIGGNEGHGGFGGFLVGVGSFENTILAVAGAKFTFYNLSHDNVNGGYYFTLCFGGIGVQKEASFYYDSNGNYRFAEETKALIGVNALVGYDLFLNSEKTFFLNGGAGFCHYETTFFKDTSYETEVKGFLPTFEIGLGIWLK